MTNGNLGSMVKGMGAGMLLGITASVIGVNVLNKNQKLKRSSSRAVHAVGNMLNDAQSMLK